MQIEKRSFFHDYFLEISWIMMIGIGVLWRLTPHIPNLTPFIGLSLFAGAYISRKLSFLIILLALFISDLGLALIVGYPIVSYYTFFTYTGFLTIILLGSGLAKSSKWQLPAYVVGSSLIFWVWTNFGVWLTSAFYAKTFSGLVLCYYLALPFLHNALIGDLVWSCLIFGIFYLFLGENSLKAKI